MQKVSHTYTNIFINLSKCFAIEKHVLFPICDLYIYIYVADHIRTRSRSSVGGFPYIHFLPYIYHSAIKGYYSIKATRFLLLLRFMSLHFILYLRLITLGAVQKVFQYRNTYIFFHIYVFF